MSENVFENSGEAASFERPRAFNTIVYGGLVVGILDMLFAFTFYGLILGAPPLRIFQSVAAGVLGRTAAYEGGIRTFLLGILLHFVVGTCIATVYFLASRVWPMLIRHPVVSGLIYGMIAYLGMNYIVVPLSAIGRRSAPLNIPIFLTEIIGHAFLVGLPLALLARRSAKKNGHDFRNSASAETSLNPSDTQPE
jgi:uncharacterized membrane protein YagU involved in acid resistance